ncbi:5-carboxymethyl-2-hydroxymuconate Delta-isomerase [Erwinia persicina]|uniref:5-carboxymethyl-2-hydroxymuconate Delta-isomerase n=1 Tax=Erwinia persicina TaxID=55211 RepID=A0A3S7TGY8_9GAMM|nr:5-carboxymethyl-2-hydroxymuconate Delta-isomerase [Erwinia persicina]AXU98234.1 5-carboxymethyl-2-hydroxymuconate delta-isomerase [Erwinia persicina]MBC3947758.1 5-carboxymethyl-2-hydroxymuconate Delta-isomerase [Erwinia persicina]MBD8108127.1 5-carboxymethyl-2-hydroxymuconate Delta-isomerase [Erwinia persicina]MBD8169651.1 5-carboxymethyl-2-hydroxymuconate Delta-isomerase [Erwinia persicina]MBD8211269.1 5-carboxymethyl-2-hydroxymuconate Delta-isomerase [Erwinia persicina]
MPHFIVECSDNIREQAQFPALFSRVNAFLADSGLFPLAGIRSRVHWVETWQMADGQQDYAFVHMTLKIGHGRRAEQLRPVLSGLFELIKSHFAALMARRYLALSLVLEELHPQFNFKQNNVHALFQA